MSDYPDSDFPWTFYFNGVAMPKWGAQWAAFTPVVKTNWDWDVGPRDLYIVGCAIDHVGKVESANAHIFLYAVQELMCILFTEQAGVMERIRNWTGENRNSVGENANPNEIYDGLVAAAFEMRALARRDGHAFWISGYEADRLQLIETIRRSTLAQNDSGYLPPPHIAARASQLNQLWQSQIKTLHGAASSGNLSKAMRKKLLEL